MDSPFTLCGLLRSVRLLLRVAALHDRGGGDCTDGHEGGAHDGGIDDGEHDFLS